MRKTESLKICLLANPSAGRGRCRRALPRIRAAFARERITDVRVTARAGDEEWLTAEALDDGATTIVAVGGDGTCSRIANVILAKRSSCRLGVVPVGTGNDFAKTLGVFKLSYPDIARLTADSSVCRMDVGRIENIFFLNGCGFGIDPAILAATQRIAWLRGNAVYIWSALTKLFAYRGISVAVEGATSGPALQTQGTPPEGRMMMITVSNGRNLGGAFKIAPQASVCDGVFDIHFFGDAPAGRRLKIFFAAFRGTHAAFPEVEYWRRASLTARFDAPPQMEVDGEIRNASSALVRMECLPGALSVVAAPGYPL